tara:strand:+ start:311 stop:1048 length:738 start_codon:yes stop_codon:yes gene_type:complete
MGYLNSFTFFIPARMESSRLYGKPLLKIGKNSLIERVYLNCSMSKYCKQVFIVTDSKDIKNHCIEKGMNFIITGKHNCASNRVAEASLQVKDHWIVEVQGDEPFLNNKIIDKWISKSLREIKRKYSPDIFLSYAKLNYNKSHNYNFVKIVFDENFEAKWFSRSKLPSDWKGRKKSKMYRHTGFHLWKRKSLVSFGKIKPSYIEKSEDTHAVRLTENNFCVKGIEIPDTLSIDTPNDLKNAKKIAK